MPELPEVETSVQAIQEFSNQNIESIEIYNPNLRWKVDCKAFKNLSGLKVSKINRRAKYIIFHLNHSQILIHLGMTGTLRIAKKEHYKIAASTKKILKTAIKAGGTTLKDFYQPDGNKGYFKIDLAVYDREDETCKNCKKELIKRMVQAQRATFYCQKCQI